MSRLPYTYKKILNGLAFYFVLLFTIAGPVTLLTGLGGYDDKIEYVAVITQYTFFFWIFTKLFVGKKTFAISIYILGIIMAILFSPPNTTYFQAESFLFPDNSDFFTYMVTIMLVMGFPLDIICALAYCFLNRLFKITS